MSDRETSAFDAPFASPDEELARENLERLRFSRDEEEAIAREAADVIGHVRHAPTRLGSVEQLLREFALTTSEGVALMVIAEALLRIPDPATMDRLIEDRLGLPDFAEHVPQSADFFSHASVWALGAASSFLNQGAEAGLLMQTARRIGVPALRAAMRKAIVVIGDAFVYAPTIEAARQRAQANGGLYSFDMLGEAARTTEDAQRYAQSCHHAIETIGQMQSRSGRQGVSVKLSALHPRYEPLSRQQALEELTPILSRLAHAAKKRDILFTVDAEEADRLELSLDIIARVLGEPSLAGWTGFGVAVQAYQKRAAAVIDHLAALARRLDRRITIRLVKGAYWDLEIKRAQERGLADYPVFTRKAMTDLNYLACAQRLLAHAPHIAPQFATHNALTIATLRAMAQGRDDVELQRLFGMGEAIHADFAKRKNALPVRIYAPVGPSRDLLAYLVRRLLENGASASFLARLARDDIPADALVRQPMSLVTPPTARSKRIVRPADLFGAGRRNSPGLDFGDGATLRALLHDIAVHSEPGRAAPLIDGVFQQGPTRAARSPINDSLRVGDVIDASFAQADAAMEAAARGFGPWSRTPPVQRAACLLRAAELLERERPRLLALLQIEGGKTIDDALSEWREAYDYCAYYAAEATRIFEPRAMPGPVGEMNEWTLQGRGVFVAISPWNFPLAIFMGQTAAALVAGNSVVAKPAEQTPIIAFEVIRLLHEAGVPVGALQLATGDGAIGARLVAHAAVSGVVFTGSTEVARAINRTLAAREGEIVPFIAETGGLNAMIVDSTALPEQVTDDVLASAFRSAGQRCSALRHLYIQDDSAGSVLDMIAGALATWRIGDPRDPETRIGPVIDADARKALDDYLAQARATHRILYQGVAPEGGCFVAPHIIELADPAALTREIFGPVLHVTRYRREDLPSVLSTIARSGYGLTFGLQSRIGAMTGAILDAIPAGNIYVNRNMIGAVVGSQPFGGRGLSGTGPKAGGPHYLARFCTERTLTINTAALGGDPALLDTQD
ncbi:MAG: delta-pyrroline-5-carboxylate dehydrogenase [Hyphomicrobiales bacterium]|nr:delta-pyrroline-5-carboxylate dehydrogenase [Hyphomicrobiales bacterium]